MEEGGKLFGGGYGMGWDGMRCKAGRGATGVVLAP